MALASTRANANVANAGEEDSRGGKKSEKKKKKGLSLDEEGTEGNAEER